MCALTAAAAAVAAALALAWWVARQAGESAAAAVCCCICCCCDRLDTSASARRMGVCGAAIVAEGATECIGTMECGRTGEWAVSAVAVLCDRSAVRPSQPLCFSCACCMQRPLKGSPPVQNRTLRPSAMTHTRRCIMCLHILLLHWRCDRMNRDRCRGSTRRNETRRKNKKK